METQDNPQGQARVETIAKDTDKMKKAAQVRAKAESRAELMKSMAQKKQ